MSCRIICDNSSLKKIIKHDKKRLRELDYIKDLLEDKYFKSDDEEEFVYVKEVKVKDVFVPSYMEYDNNMIADLTIIDEVVVSDYIDYEIESEVFLNNYNQISENDFKKRLL